MGKCFYRCFAMNLPLEEWERRIHANEITNTKTLAHWFAAFMPKSFATAGLFGLNCTPLFMIWDYLIKPTKEGNF